jgi:putative ABC transport system permease protein
MPARRAVIRWAVRLLRREWRQHLLILALIIAAVGATIVGSAVATNTPSPATASFGTANHAETFGAAGPRVTAQIASLRQRFGRVDVIENQTLSVPGSIQTYDLRAQNPHGPFGQPMLSLVSGHYPVGASQVAVTSGVAADFRLRIGDTWTVGGAARQVVGIVMNPQNTLDQFALVPPGQVQAPTQITILFDAPGRALHPIGPNVTTPSMVANANVINPATISLAAAALGMLLVALVGVGGFTVLAQRRLRSIGMLGAQGATDRNIRLVVRANGVATGAVGALAGLALGVAVWLAWRPQVESSTHHQIGAFQLPWIVVAEAMVLAVVAAWIAAARPARAIARVPIVLALSGRPAPPKAVHRLALPAGLACLAVAFFLLGAAGAAPQGGALPVLLGLVTLVVAVILLAPMCLAVVARLARRGPVSVRLALRDLARYRARSGPALGAISLSVLIAIIICVASAARFGNMLDYAGPNLASNQLVVWTQGQPQGTVYTGPGSGPAKPSSPGGPSPAQILAKQAAGARGIAAALGSGSIIALQTSDGTLQHAAPGRSWNGAIYVATPQLLRAFGVRQADINPSADVLTMRPGLSGYSHMQLVYGNYPGSSGASHNGNSFPCPPNSCLANPVIQEVSALPSGTSAPNTLITEHAVQQLGLHVSTVGWLIQAPSALTASQIYNARQAAGLAGLSIETRNSIPTLSEITNLATLAAIVLALGILAMNVGLIRSETAGQVRTLAATGANGMTRRNLTAAVAGSLGLIGAVLGTIAGYIAVIGFLRTNQLDLLSSLGSIPVKNLLAILIGMPLLGAAGGWLLAGREPAAMGRLPLE